METELAAIDLPDEAATKALGARLAGALRRGDVIRLEGGLGAGKSTLARAAIAILAGEKSAPSPTFTLVETYEADQFTLWHFDLYRLEKPEDAYELGIEEALENAVVMIEWPERIEGLLPDDALTVRIEVIGAVRRAVFLGPLAWRARLAAAGIATQ